MRYIWILLIAITMADAASARGAVKESNVIGKMLTDVSAVTAGSSFTVAVEVVVQPGWHIYWSNPGDAGERTKLKYVVPAGYEVTPAAFPLPEKFAQPGDIVAYGYAGKVVFLATVKVPKVLPAGETVRIGVRVSWLCCKDVCVPGGTSLSLELPVAKAGAAAKGAADDANRELIAKARVEIPDETSAKVDVSGVEGDKGRLTIAWKNPPQGEIEVFPLTLDEVEVSDVKTQTRDGKTHITLHTRLLAGQKLKTDALPLLVVYHDAKGQRRGFFTTWSLHALAAGEK